MRFEFDVDLKPVWHRPQAPTEPKKRVSPIRRTLVLAYQIADYIAANNMPTLKAFCQHAHITSARATQIMNMQHLSPKIQAYILMKDHRNLSKLSEFHIRPLI